MTGTTQSMGSCQLAKSNGSECITAAAIVSNSAKGPGLV